MICRNHGMRMKKVSNIAATPLPASIVNHSNLNTHFYANPFQSFFLELFLKIISLSFVYCVQITTSNCAVLVLIPIYIVKLIGVWSVITAISIWIDPCIIIGLLNNVFLYKINSLIMLIGTKVKPKL